MKSAQLASLGILVVFIGFFVTFVGAFQGSSGTVSSGGFILIGPFPIIFGKGPNSGYLASFGVAISVVMIAFYLLTYLVGRGRRRAEIGEHSE